MKSQSHTFDITYCSNTHCKSIICERHPGRLAALRDQGLIQPGDMVSMADFSGVCREYLNQIIEEE